MKIPRLVLLLLLVTLFKQIVFSMIVPVWHTPDEQAHFGQIAYNAEFGKMPLTGNDLNNEIYQSEALLGTLRDERGNNKFTYHSEYKIDYTNSQTGLYENQINNIPISERKNLVRQESTNYPPLYYIFGGWMYNSFYFADLFTRVYAVRFLSIIFGVATVYIAFLIAKKIFPKDESKQLLLPIFVAFQPMASFLSSGVNSDNLLNFLFSFFILLCLDILETGLNKKNIISLVVSLILMYFTKPQVVFAIPIILGLLVLLIIKSSSRNNLFNKKNWPLGIGLFIGLVLTGFFYYLSRNFAFPLQSFLGNLYSFAPGGREVTNESFLLFLKDSLKHTYAETLPWYWGVFDWLGVTLPHLANRLINYTLILSLIGLIFKFYRDFKERIFDYKVIFLLLISVIYYLAIIYYNYIFYLAHGFSFGLQGRYFFPTLVAHMALIIVGLTTIFNIIRVNFNKTLIKSLALLMIILNFVALGVLIKTYYSTADLNTLTLQISQNKPAMFKGFMIWIWFTLYLYFLGFFLWRYFLSGARFNFSKFRFKL